MCYHYLVLLRRNFADGFVISSSVWVQCRSGFIKNEDIRFFLLKPWQLIALPLATSKVLIRPPIVVSRSFRFCQNIGNGCFFSITSTSSSSVAWVYKIVEFSRIVRKKLGILSNKTDLPAKVFKSISFSSNPLYKIFSFPAGDKAPPAISINVVLPEPEGPLKAMVSPFF